MFISSATFLKKPEAVYNRPETQEIELELIAISKLKEGCSVPKYHLTNKEFILDGHYSVEQLERLVQLNNYIHSIHDIQPHVANKKEIRFTSQPNNTILGCYMFMDSKTFDSPEALECRGIVFDSTGKIISRPLHKFFNLGEKEDLSIKNLLERTDIYGIYEKLDGSMIATALVDNELVWRSKKSFSSEVVKLAQRFLSESENYNIVQFSNIIAQSGMTAIFELTHPEARIVVGQDKPRLRLLHIRDNVTGQYVLLDKAHPEYITIQELLHVFDVPLVQKSYIQNLQEALNSLETMQNQEGYVVQFMNGDMVKIKCPWYSELHRTITFLRERDIAELCLDEKIDDVKGSLKELGINSSQVEEIETKLKSNLTNILEEIDQIYIADKDLERKDFALKHSKHPLFGLCMNRYLGKEPNLTQWYKINRLKTDFTLRVLVNDIVTETLEG